MGTTLSALPTGHTGVDAQRIVPEASWADAPQHAAPEEAVHPRGTSRAPATVLSDTLHADRNLT